MKHVIAAALLVLVFVSPSAAASLVVKTSGEVSVKFHGADASYTSILQFHRADGSTQQLFNNHTSTVGDVVSLGNFQAGERLDFSLLVQDTGHTFSLDGANPDGLEHALLQGMGNDTLVGFEDMFGGGDRDYNDLMYLFSNTEVVQSTPEAGTFILMGTGLVLLWMCRRLSLRRLAL